MAFIKAIDKTQPASHIDASTIHVDACENGAAIRKTSQAAVSALSQPVGRANNSLTERISADLPRAAASDADFLPVPLSDPAYSVENLREVERCWMDLIQNPGDVNYMNKLREVIAEILAQFSQIADKDRTQIDDLKKRYQDATKEAAGLTRSLGDMRFYFAAAGFAVYFGQFFFSHQDDRPVVKYIAENVVPQIGGMVTGRYDSHQKKADALAQLVMAEYQAKTSKGQSDASNKQEIVALLDKALDSMKRAASA